MGNKPSAAPIDPSQDTVANVLLRYLELEGVTHIFGVPGGGLIEMLDELYPARDRLAYVVCRQETGAGYMADGYYRASGKLGVVMVTTGPGATNALTGVMNAEAGGSAMLALTGEVAEQYFGMGYLQEGIDGKLDVNDVFKSAAAYSAVVTSPGNARTLIEGALRVAMGIPRHVAHLSLPVDVTGAAADLSLVPASPARYRTAPSAVSPDDVAAALDHLAGAKRPLIMLGNGCREALRDPTTATALRTVVERWAMPVMTSADGKGVFPESHPMSLRVFGIANCIWPYYWMTQKDPAYDALLVIGSGMGELATNKWNPLLKPQGPIIQVDADSRIIARDLPVALGIVGEAGAFIRALAGETAKLTPDQATVDAREAAVQAIKEAHSPFFAADQYDSVAAPIQPAALCRVMQEVLPKDTIIMLDAGNCVGWGCHYLRAEPGFEVHSSLDMGPMGFAVGAVVGAKLARPGATCVAFTGDAAFMMHGAEISTAQRNSVGAIWIVLHDNDLKMVSQGMAHFKGRDEAVWRELYSLGNPDLVKYAQGLGADACSIDDPASLAEALAAALKGAEKGRPQVIVAEIDCAACPPYYNPLYMPSRAEAQAAAKGSAR